MAEFARGRVCRGRVCQEPRLLGAEMSSIHLTHTVITLFVLSVVLRLIYLYSEFSGKSLEIAIIIKLADWMTQQNLDHHKLLPDCQINIQERYYTELTRFCKVKCRSTFSTIPIFTSRQIQPLVYWVKRSAIVRNWYNQIPHPVRKTKRKTTKYINWQQFTKGTCGKPNEQPFLRQVVIQLPKFTKVCH